MSELGLIKLIDECGIPLKDIEQSNVHSYGNEFYGNNKDNIHYSTRGIRLGTKGKFSEHYMKTSYVTDIGITNSEESKIHINLATVYQEGRFIELVVLDGQHEYKITNVMKKVLIELQPTYEIIDISHVSHAGSPIFTTTFILKSKEN